MSNRRNRRQKNENPFLPSLTTSSRSVIPSNENRRNLSVNSRCMKQRKAERGKWPSKALQNICRALKFYV